MAVLPATDNLTLIYGSVCYHKIIIEASSRSQNRSVAQIRYVQETM